MLGEVANAYRDSNQVICYSNTIYDRFPTTHYLTSLKTDLIEGKFDRRYHYFGPRGSGFISSRNSLRQMLDAICLASTDERKFRDISEAFHLVGYDP